MEKILRFLWIKVRWIVGGIAVVCLALTVYYFMANRLVTTSSALSMCSGIIDMGEGDIVEQKVSFCQQDLALSQAEIKIMIGTYQNKYKEGRLTLSLITEDGQMVKKESIECKNILDNSYMGIDISSLQPDNPYILRIELENFKNNRGALAIWTGEVKESTEEVHSSLIGSATRNGQSLPADQYQQLYITINGLEQESGIQRAYYPLTLLLIMGAIFFLLPQNMSGKQEEECRNA